MPEAVSMAMLEWRPWSMTKTTLGSLTVSGGVSEVAQPVSSSAAAATATHALLIPVTRVTWCGCPWGHFYTHGQRSLHFLRDLVFLAIATVGNKETMPHSGKTGMMR